VEDSSLDGAALSAARRAPTLSGDTSPGAALSAARRATLLSGDTSPEAHMRRAASILNGEGHHGRDDRVGKFVESLLLSSGSGYESHQGSAKGGHYSTRTVNATRVFLLNTLFLQKAVALKVVDVPWIP
jgi:hypothetical protein